MGFLKRKCDKNHMDGELVKTQIVGPRSRVLDPAGLGWDLRI